MLFFFFIQNMFIGVVSHSSWCRILLVLLPSEGASFCKPCFSSCRLAEDSRAANTQNCCLCMAGHFTSMKQELGLCNRLFLCFLFSFGEGYRRSFGRGMFSWGGCHCRKAFFHFFFFFFLDGDQFWSLYWISYSIASALLCWALRYVGS